MKSFLIAAMLAISAVPAMAQQAETYTTEAYNAGCEKAVNTVGAAVTMQRHANQNRDAIASASHALDISNAIAMFQLLNCTDTEALRDAYMGTAREY